MFIDFTERGRERVRKRDIDVREKHHQLPPIGTTTEEQSCNLGMCPDWDLNSQRFGILHNVPTY